MSNRLRPCVPILADKHEETAHNGERRNDTTDTAKRTRGKTARRLKTANLFPAPTIPFSEDDRPVELQVMDTNTFLFSLFFTFQNKSTVSCDAWQIPLDAGRSGLVVYNTHGPIVGTGLSFRIIRHEHTYTSIPRGFSRVVHRLRSPCHPRGDRLRL